MTARSKTGVSAAIAAVALCLGAISLAHAELTERGGLFIRFKGGISPSALPRTKLAPIAVSVSGTIKTLSGARPPSLRRIRIELNRGGVLDSRGLPVCHYRDLLAASAAQAMAACGDALVGLGAYSAETAFPEQQTFPSEGRIRAFNGLYQGHEAILAHIHGNDPGPMTRIIVFRIRRTAGTFGTTLTGNLPDSLNHYGCVIGIHLELFRRYTFHSERRSYISAACAAPAGFGVATFPFARVSMKFANGRWLSSTLIRSCRVSG